MYMYDCTCTCTYTCTNGPQVETESGSSLLKLLVASLLTLSDILSPLPVSSAAASCGVPLTTVTPLIVNNMSPTLSEPLLK